MKHSAVWIEGTASSGKTTRLVTEFCHWVDHKRHSSLTRSPIESITQNLASAVLILSANDDNRRDLTDQLSMSVNGSYPIIGKTPLGFFRDEINLFWPLLFEELKLNAQFPLLLRPETEQMLATELWRSPLAKHQGQLTGSREFRFVRQTLDLIQLAGASGIAIEDIPYILEQGLEEGDQFLEQFKNSEGLLNNFAQFRGDLCLKWQQWCLERGFLTYGLIYSLYWRYLLPNFHYQRHLISRYQGIFADDVDDYPAIAKDLFKFLLDQGAFGVFTYNPEGQIRLGLNADPEYFAQLAKDCHVEILDKSAGLAKDYGELIVQLGTDPLLVETLPPVFQSIPTISRAELLRKTAEFIVQTINSGQINPEDIAIIAPGLDEIARYTFMEILSASHIPIKPLNEQRPLISFPIVRALLTLLGLIYPGLGHLISGDDVAQMLTVLSQDYQAQKPLIDPVRAGIIADACYQINWRYPKLLAVETYPRWDRLGHQATEAYQSLGQWIEETKNLVEQQKFKNPISVLDRAIKQLIEPKIQLSYEQSAALRELTETTQHFWEVDRRLRQYNPDPKSPRDTLAELIILLRKGTITANPRPQYSLGKQPGYVTLSTIFQYRSLRASHRWQFWLDISSNLWEKGGAAVLFGAPLFLREWSGRMLTPEDELNADQARLKRILKDLLGRAEEKVIFCHSDLSVKGTEQNGPLLTLVNGSQEIEFDE